MNDEVYRFLLCQMIMSKKAFYGSVMRDEYFPKGKLRQVFRIIMSLYTKGGEVDANAVRLELPEEHQIWFATKIAGAIPTAANYSYYAKKVRDKYEFRAVKTMIEQASSMREGEDIKEFIGSQLSKVTIGADVNIINPDESAVSYVGKSEQRHRQVGLPGIETGMFLLDEVIHGFQKQRLYLIGGRPSEGKTALMTSLICNIAKHGKAVGVVSLESASDELYERIFANIGEIDNQDLARGRVKDFSRITDIAADIGNNWRLYMCDKPGLTLPQIKAVIRELVIVKKAEVVFLDYLQMIKQEDTRQQYRLHINECSIELKNLARELNVPIVVLAQLSRNAEGREPRLSDFKESGQIEQDADVAILITMIDSGDFLDIAKNRDGRKDRIPVNFERQYMRFTGRITA